MDPCGTDIIVVLPLL